MQHERYNNTKLDRKRALATSGMPRPLRRPLLDLSRSVACVICLASVQCTFAPAGWQDRWSIGPIGCANVTSLALGLETRSL